MLQQSLAGKRCRAVRFINTHNGPVPRNTQGTIRHDMDNLDRHMVFVAWDHGLEEYVFLREIELLTKTALIAA